MAQEECVSRPYGGLLREASGILLLDNGWVMGCTGPKNTAVGAAQRSHRWCWTRPTGPGMDGPPGTTLGETPWGNFGHAERGNFKLEIFQDKVELYSRTINQRSITPQ